MTDVNTGYGPDDTAVPDMGNDDENINPGSLLAALRSEAQQKVMKEPVDVRVPARPNFIFTFDTNFDFSRLQHWRKQATRRQRGKADDFDLVKFGCIVLAATNTGMVYKGSVMEYSLTSPELWEMFGANSYFECIKKVWGTDADLIRAGNEVIEAAGYGDEEEEQDDFEDDPTKTS